MTSHRLSESVATAASAALALITREFSFKGRACRMSGAALFLARPHG
jgi:hypothetical protein